jgi:hypothetical protein
MAVAILTAVVGSTLGIDATYARITAVDFVQIQVYENRLDGIERRIFEIKLVGEKRDLSGLEKQELNRLEIQKGKILRDIGRIS